MTKKKNLDELEALETQAKEIMGEPGETVVENIPQPVMEVSTNKKKNEPNLLDGYRVVDNYDLPQTGELYPESWKFAYRCPTAKEVANFSTINDQDQPAIIAAIEDLVKKCVIIYDVDKDQQIVSGHINDAHRIFFALKLREEYLPQSPLEYTSMCLLCKESYMVDLRASKLQYSPLSQKLIDAFDGRMFTLEMPGVEEPIKFLIPTIEITSKIFKYIVKVYRDSQNDREKKEDRIVYDKQFLLLAPFLYEKGTENIKELTNKFKQIQKDEARFKAYLDIANKLKLDHLDSIETECPHCKSLEEAQIRFPGGWKNMFVGTKDATGYFD